MNINITGNGVYSLGTVQGKTFYDLYVSKSCSLSINFEFNGEWIPNYQGGQDISAISAPYFGKVVVPAGIESARVTISDFSDPFELVFEPSVSSAPPLPSSSINQSGRLNVEILGLPSVARVIGVGSSSTNLELTASCRRISMVAVGADMRYSVGSSSQTATSSSHFIMDGERIDILVPANPNIAAIRNNTTDGILEITELQ